MTESDIFKVVQQNILQILPTLAADDIRPEISMRDLGANSIDRSEVVINSMAELSLRIPLVKFASAANIGELVQVIHQHIQNN